jgi:hypothetical protein
VNRHRRSADHRKSIRKFVGDVKNHARHGNGILSNTGEQCISGESFREPLPETMGDFPSALVHDRDFKMREVVLVKSMPAL